MGPLLLIERDLDDQPIIISFFFPVLWEQPQTPSLLRDKRVGYSPIYFENDGNHFNQVIVVTLATCEPIANIVVEWAVPVHDISREKTAAFFGARLRSYRKTFTAPDNAAEFGRFDHMGIAQPQRRVGALTHDTMTS